MWRWQWRHSLRVNGRGDGKGGWNGSIHDVGLLRGLAGSGGAGGCLSLANLDKKFQEFEQ